MLDTHFQYGHRTRTETEKKRKASFIQTINTNANRNLTWTGARARMRLIFNTISEQMTRNIIRNQREKPAGFSFPEPRVLHYVNLSVVCLLCCGGGVRVCVLDVVCRVWHVCVACGVCV